MHACSFSESDKAVWFLFLPQSQGTQGLLLLWLFFSIFSVFSVFTMSCLVLSLKVMRDDFEEKNKRLPTREDLQMSFMG